MLAGDVLVVGETWPTIMNDGNGYYFDWERSSVNVLQTCRQIYEEAKPILYSRARFSFGADPYNGSSVITVLYFLERTVPFNALKNIRHLEFSMWEKININNTTNLLTTTVDGDHVHGEDSNFKKLCFLLASKMHLRHLTLYVHNADKYSSSHKNTIDRSTEPHREVPGWVKPLLAIKRLDRLTLHWEYDDLNCLDRTLKAARLMRTSMIQDGERMKADDGILVRLKHKEYNPKEKRLSFEMDIDKTGKSRAMRIRRVKVVPDSECRNCGHYPATRDRNCLCGCISLDPIKALHDAIRPKEKTPAEFNDSIGNQGEEDACETRPWVEKPLREYLPKDVTEEDFHKAKAFRDAGFHLYLWDGKSRRNSYTDSDFGDTDSLNSVHGWSDDEETD